MATTVEQVEMAVDTAIDNSVDTAVDTTREVIPSGRFTPRNVSAELGLLADLAGTWEGFGFNLIARPAFHFGTDLYLQLNNTRETLKFDPIGSVIPNRGFGQNDIGLHGLTYLQKISDAGKDGALHIEPGVWIRQPNTNFPPEKAAPKGQEWWAAWAPFHMATRCWRKELPVTFRDRRFCRRRPRITTARFFHRSTARRSECRRPRPSSTSTLQPRRRH